MNSPLNQPLTMLTAQRPLLMWSRLAMALAITPGCQKPGCSALIRWMRSVTLASAAVSVRASSWYSAP